MHAVVNMHYIYTYILDHEIRIKAGLRLHVNAVCHVNYSIIHN